jgi:hypothetical protein
MHEAETSEESPQGAPPCFFSLDMTASLQQSQNTDITGFTTAYHFTPILLQASSLI